MPLQLGERFFAESKVIEIIEVLSSGNYRFERYKILDVYSGIHHAYIFYVDDREKSRGTKFVFIEDLIKKHFMEMLNVQV